MTNVNEEIFNNDNVLLSETSTHVQYLATNALTANNVAYIFSKCYYRQYIVFEKIVSQNS